MRSRKSAGSTRPLQTCDVCKLRHQKCSGERPSCSHCTLRNLQCAYSTIPAHYVDRSVVKKKNPNFDNPDGRQSPADSPVSTTQTSSGSIHPPTPPGNLMPVSEAKDASKLEKKTPKPTGPRSATTASLEYLVDVVKVMLLPPEARGGGVAEHQMSFHQYQRAEIPTLWAFSRAQPDRSLDKFALPLKTYTQSLLDAFFRGFNSFIHVCDPSESYSQLDTLYSQGESTQPQIQALLYLQLCLGADCADGTTEEECATWFARGQESLETALQSDQGNWLWIAQAMVLTCLHEAKSSPTKCYINLGSAVKIAQTYQIDVAFEESSIESHDEYSKWRQLWLSMISLDAWFSTILGRTPLITATTSKDPFLKNLNLAYGQPNCTVQSNMSKMGIIVCRMLKDVHSGRRIDIRVYDQYLLLLERWINNVPEHLRLSPIPVDGLMMSERDQSAMFQLKIAHLGSIILLTRPLLLHCAATEKQQPSFSLPPKVLEHAQTCVDAAIRVGYCCFAMMSRGLFVRRYWPITYSIFTSALILAISITRRRRAGGSNMTARQQGHNNQEESSFETCIEVLTYCAEQDSVAKHFLRILQNIRSGLVDYQSALQQPVENPTTPLTMDRLRLPSISRPVPISHDSSSTGQSTSSAPASGSTSTSTSTSTSATISTQQTPIFSPPSMDGLELTDRLLFTDADFDFLAQDSGGEVTQNMGGQEVGFGGMGELNMSDWSMSPQHLSDEN